MVFRRSASSLYTICMLLLSCLCSAASAQEFESAWPQDVERVWVGPEYWANRLQDWRISGGRLECTQGAPGKPFRTVHLLTRRLGDTRGDLAMSVRIGVLGESGRASDTSAAGFLIGAGPDVDYRAASLVHHSTGPGGGIVAGVDGRGRAVFRDMTARGCPIIASGEDVPAGIPGDAMVHLIVEPVGDTHRLMLTVRDSNADTVLSRATLENVSGDRMVGNIALVSHPGSSRGSDGGARYWFRDWRVSGTKIELHEDWLCGPILSTQYTLSRDVMTMTAQMMPLGENDTRTVKLGLQENGSWKTADTAEVIESGYTATFRVDNWDSSNDTPYRVVYDLRQADGSTKPYMWSGTIRREPTDKSTVVVAAFTGNHNVHPGGVDRGTFVWTRAGLWFPHTDITASVAKHDPDVLFFSGDQVYESASPTRSERTALDYLYKWYLWCWAFRDLTRDRPSVCIPDDHDVYHGNLWGAGGRHAESPDDGGYTMPAEFVNMVQRTMTSNLPDPNDPTPVEQGIGVYYCAMNYGGISFAVVEDRKFKSSPTVMVPDGQVENGWFQNPNFDPAKQADVPGATLLGDRQLRFLHDWAADWSHGAQMKAVLSQTLFSNLATLPSDAPSDKVVPRLSIVPVGVYPPDDRRVADADSNGWPQTGRNKALREMRRGFALHISGDQHLGSTIQYGVDDWRDAGFALCVPSVGNFFPRRWFPPEPGFNREPGAARYTGDYLDGFGNRMTVHAVSNPHAYGHEPAALYERAPGYGIVKFNRDDRTITIECWPRWEDPAKADAKQYPGWPVTIKQTDNYGRKAVAYLPTLNISGLTDPVVQIVDESDGQIVYTLRIKGSSFRPKVFKDGTYTIRVSDPDLGKHQTFQVVRSVSPDRRVKLAVTFTE
jgi:alkaline phosphatase D